MFEYLTQLDEAFLVLLLGLCSIALLPLTGLAAFALVQYRKYRERQLELGFRNDLLQRGYSIDEIVKLLTCRRPNWSESLTGVGEWTLKKLLNGVTALTQRGALYSAAVRPLLFRALESGRKVSLHFSRVTLPTAGRLVRQIATGCRRTWEHSRPAIRRSLHQLDRGLRRLVNEGQRSWRRPASDRF